MPNVDDDVYSEDELSGDEQDVNKSSNSSTQQSSHIDPLPLQVIYRHKLNDDEIKSIPKFTNHKPGHPSNVLYLKNLHPKVTVEDLQAIFGHQQSQTTEKLKFRLLKGKMKGQAFVEFPSKKFYKALQLLFYNQQQVLN